MRTQLKYAWPFLDLNHARNVVYVFLKFELCIDIMNW